MFSAVSGVAFCSTWRLSIPAYASIEGENEFYIPNDFLERGVTEYKEIFKLIVSTAEFDAGLLELDGLNPPPQTRSLKRLDSTFNLLLERVNTREAGNSSRKLDDWMTKNIAVTIVYPQDAIQIQPNGQNEQWQRSARLRVNAVST